MTGLNECLLNTDESDIKAFLKKNYKVNLSNMQIFFASKILTDVRDNSYNNTYIFTGPRQAGKSYVLAAVAILLSAYDLKCNINLKYKYWSTSVEAILRSTYFQNNKHSCYKSYGSNIYVNRSATTSARNSKIDYLIIDYDQKFHSDLSASEREFTKMISNAVNDYKPKFVITCGSTAVIPKVPSIYHVSAIETEEQAK